MTGKEHAKLLGLLLLIYEGFQIFSLIIAGLVMVGMSGFMFFEFSKMPQRPGEPPPEVFIGIMGAVFIFIIIISVLLMIPAFVAGYGLRKGKSWAKVWTIIACSLATLSFPLGTALGVYGLWFILGDEGKAYFDNPNGKFNPPPPSNNWH